MRWYFTRANRAEEFERLPTNHTFPDAELIEITDRDVRDFMNVMAFGTTTPSNDARPTMRADYLLGFKSAISLFMPRQDTNWDPVNRAGNPTKSNAPSLFVYI
jgi:hypothetical protein